MKHDELLLNEVLSHAKALEAVASHKQAFQKPSEIFFKLEAKFKSECYRYGRKTHEGSANSCPALKQRCNKCNFLGHYASKCRTRNSKRRYNNPSDDGSPSKRSKFGRQKQETTRAINDEDETF